ncbi:MAG TPA: 4-hydroxy-tetrahydrodipicolinate reductase [Clostridiales bacterium UBA8960]|jgi:4-hydroxy-tetrahydrodipicolinate reductase|nr:4-hydroxy-tetrahydrodipicolinate reductase [Clostridiales bacterium UBA8960]
MIKLFVCGVTGAMGKNIVELARQSGKFEIVGGLGQHPEEGLNYPVFEHFDDVSVPIDVIIDFSNASVVDELIKFSVAHRCRTVICTTGLSKETELNIQSASRSVALFKSGNMSLGINLITKLIEQAASVLDEQYDVEIIEKHHNRKLDAPSGTALMLADAVNNGVTLQKSVELGRKAIGKKERSTLNIHSVRGGTIVGEHEVMFAGDDEIITISHGAYSRRVFAKGALDAAAFLIGKPAGLYDMNDLLADLLETKIK